MRGALAAAMAALCACALGLADTRTHGEADISPMPFVFGRYGRAPDRTITQRNTKWAMTTRYGKRAVLATEGVPCPPRPPRPPPAEPGGALSCTYTGVLSLYTCTRNAGPELRRNEDVLRSSNYD